MGLWLTACCGVVVGRFPVALRLAAYCGVVLNSMTVRLCLTA